MATADELLGTITDITDDFLLVDLNTRIISIPASITNLGVESDDDVKHLRFKVPRKYGEYDLSTFSVQVNFENANGEGDFYLVKDLEISDENTMTFTWIVDRHAFKRHGDVDFSLCMKKFDQAGVVIKEFNTTFATLPVLKGLETTKAVVENNASAFDSVLFRLYAVEAATGNSTNGYYTIASVKETNDGVQISISGSDGTSVATIKNGTNGQDGYTPVKGVDYWTTSDKTSIKNELISSFATKTSTITLASTSWSNNSQRVSYSGITSSSVVIVSPGPAKSNRDAYGECGICCVEQGTNYLRFECETTPTVSISVNIAILATA